MKFCFGGGNKVKPDITIVGIVRDFNQDHVKSVTPNPYIYVPYSQRNELDGMSFPEAVVPLVGAPSPERGEIARALRVSLSRLPFHAASKTALGLRGVPVSAEVCAPLRGLTEDEQAEVARIVAAWQG